MLMSWYAEWIRHSWLKSTKKLNVNMVFIHSAKFINKSCFQGVGRVRGVMFHKNVIFLENILRSGLTLFSYKMIKRKLDIKIFYNGKYKGKVEIISSYAIFKCMLDLNLYRDVNISYWRDICGLFYRYILESHKVCIYNTLDRLDRYIVR